MTRQREISHFVDICDVSRDDLVRILAISARLKAARAGKRRGERDAGAPLAGTMLALIFEKPSTRTRVSFDVAMRQMGGDTLMLSANELQLGRGESIADTARVLSRLVDAIMIRSGDHDAVVELARWSQVPIINGLTPRSHPCQIMADLLTLEEHTGTIADAVVGWVGDGNNVALSWIHAAALLGFELRLACPPELAPQTSDLAWARALNPRIAMVDTPGDAVANATCVVTDAWVSMGDTDIDRRKALLAPYRVDAALMARAHVDAVFMHCLPAYRGNETTEEVIEGPQSVVFDEAENRLHAQKGILAWCLDAEV
jgi:ornithine carbamoyltransferase